MAPNKISNDPVNSHQIYNLQPTSPSYFKGGDPFKMLKFI
jgi:hypothetical protein